MPFTSGERSLHRTQAGVEDTPGTPVPATDQLNMEQSGIIDLDRAPDDLQEDYGHFEQAVPGRGTFGVRRAALPMRGVGRYQDLQLFLDSAVAGGIAPVAGVWTFPADSLSSTVRPRTIEEGDNVAVYQMSYSLIEELRLAFNALASPGNAPLALTANWFGQDKVKIDGFTPDVAAVDRAETIMGHLCRAYIGDVDTAFADLAEVKGLVAAELIFPTGIVPRKFGGTSDLFDSHGRMMRTTTMQYQFYQTNDDVSDTLTELYDRFQDTGPQQLDFRMRLLLVGSGSNQLYWDHEMRINTLPVTDVGGASIFNLGGKAVTALSDEENLTDVTFVLTNGL